MSSRRLLISVGRDKPQCHMKPQCLQISSDPDLISERVRETALCAALRLPGRTDAHQHLLWRKLGHKKEESTESPRNQGSEAWICLHHYDTQHFHCRTCSKFKWAGENNIYHLPCHWEITPDMLIYNFLGFVCGKDSERSGYYIIHVSSYLCWKLSLLFNPWSHHLSDFAWCWNKSPTPRVKGREGYYAHSHKGSVHGQLVRQGGVAQGHCGGGQPTAKQVRQKPPKQQVTQQPAFVLTLPRPQALRAGSSPMSTPRTMPRQSGGWFSNHTH